MKLKIILLSTILLLACCAPYKQLQPKPPLSPAEAGYMELKKGKKDFKLDKEKQYFIVFPAPMDDNFYLVLDMVNKQKIETFLTAKLVKKTTYGEKIKDETHKPKQLSVYPITNRDSLYYWIIDRVPEDIVLGLKYRYVPQWRWKFETKHDEFKRTLKKNRTDRSTYQTIGTKIHLDGFNFQGGMGNVKKHLEALEGVHRELLVIDSLFPPSILNSNDEAYRNYLTIKKDLEEEITFQKNYLATLDFFHKEQKTRSNPAGYLGLIDDFINYFSEKKRYPDNVIKEAQAVTKKRLEEMVPFYIERLAGKDNALPFDPKAYMLDAFNKIPTLYDKADLAVPQKFSDLSKFVNEFDKKSKTLVGNREALSQVKQSIKKLPKMPKDDFFPGIIAKVIVIQKNVPGQIGKEHGNFSTYQCSKLLNKEITQFILNTEKLLGKYREAQTLVPKLNDLKSEKDYSAMLGILKKKKHLGFLIDKYRVLDKMSLDGQENNIRKSLQDYRWGRAEKGLFKLHRDKNFLNPKKMIPKKNKVVRELEDSIYIQIDRVSRYRVGKFAEEKVSVLEDVDSLYTDSVFLPCYDVKFSSGTKVDLIQRKNDLVAHLAKMKKNEFPAKAITLLYEEFVKNPKDQGVAKGWAIVSHGKHYKGDDKKIKKRVSEIDPYASKWIVKPTQYRRVFVLPVKNEKKKNNTYFFRLNIRIPTEAKFPVYDVNIRLPKQIAKKATKAKWYKKMTMNKKVLKSEGRFTISAPDASNNYECQITPVRMKKDRNNYLNVTFNHPAFKVFTISVMVQKPIIKKN